MSTRRPVRINAEMPELAPAQAHFLWNFLDDLAYQLWDAYEPELLRVQDDRSPPHPDSDCADADPDDIINDNSVCPDDPNPEF
ncbi:MAG: hypothetical protein HY814_04660 [Candidatus Riflebacteria bacterium]|nr:hypothetical protein [Candidatus Riflebacteria bacterium]